jgi:lipopolysaccharide biosynthesis glycosyltransferase
VHAGRANAIMRMESDNEKLKWLLENTVGDDTGDNISEKNGTFNEMTTVYWAWKNYDTLGNPDYIGFMHYRRHFIFDDTMEKASYECLDICEDYYDQIKYDEEKIIDIMDDCDFVCTKPQWRKSLYEHFRLNHEIEDLDTTLNILKKKYPEYAEAADHYVNGQNAFFCNMFIFPREIFFQYAEWFFDITLELMEQIDFTNKRLFVSEWLTGIFITYLLENGKKAKYLPMMIAEGEHEIPLVLASDNGYAYPMIVTIASALQTAKANTTYSFYLLVSDDFSRENREIIDRICGQYQRCKYQFIDMHNAYDDANLSIEHITKATYYRLQLPSLLQDLGKCIYLDVDIVVKNDLSALYRMCIDDKYIAGVRALGYLQSDKKIETKLEELEIESLEEYVNAGVLLMNLAKMRRDNLEDKFAELLKKDFKSQDQDILNVACYGRIRMLPFKFNAMTKYPLYSDKAYSNTKYLQKWIEKSDWNNGRKHPTIIHYADKKKPWNDLSSIYAQEWWDVIDKLPDDVAHKITKYYFGNLIEAAYETEQARKLAVAHKKDALKKLKRLKKSKTYKVGNIILFVPKKILGGMKCIKQHGVSYTIKLFFKKITRR